MGGSERSNLSGRVKGRYEYPVPIGSTPAACLEALIRQPAKPAIGEPKDEASSARDCKTLYRRQALHVRGSGTTQSELLIRQGVRNQLDSRRCLENFGIEGDTPVGEI
jgi:hypothetical protein